MTQAIKEKIYNIVSEVFGVPREELGDDSSPDSILNWDSQLVAFFVGAWHSWQPGRFGSSKLLVDRHINP